MFLKPPGRESFSSCSIFRQGSHFPKDCVNVFILAISPVDNAAVGAYLLNNQSLINELGHGLGDGSSCESYLLI